MGAAVWSARRRARATSGWALTVTSPVVSGDATLRELRARRRLGLVGAAILAVWVLGAAAAFAARTSGFL